MNLNSLSFALSQINYLTENLNKKNFKSSHSEILSLIDIHGFEAERHLHRCLISLIDFNSDTKTGGKDFHQTQLLKECFVSSVSKSNYSTIICFAFENSTHFQQSFKYQNTNLLTQISKLLKLNLIQEVAVTIALRQCAIEEIRTCAESNLKQKLSELLDSLDTDTTDKDPLNIGELSIDLIQRIYSELEKFPIKNEERENKKNWKKYFKDLLHPSLQHTFDLEKRFQRVAPVNESVSDNEIKSLKMENSLMEFVQEVGYGFTSNPEECRNALQSFNPAIKDMLNPLNVAKVLGMMARTHNNLNADWQYQSEFENKDGSQVAWNPDVFVLTVQELTPKIDWKNVVKEFDHAEFIIRDRVALKLITQAIKRVLRDPFPIEHIYRTWKNSEGQLSWIIHSIKYPDIFCLADYPSKKTATECLKAQPEDDNKLIASWRSLNLLEVLLNLSEAGVYASCLELFKFPITHCPDLLILGLLQLNTLWNRLKQEIISFLIPIFLGNHPNSAVILQHAWNQSYNTHIIRTLIMNSMADWYTKAQDTEQNIRLARILDVSQDLKALSILLNGQPLIFNIDLACLAARRGYLKLDKWMSDRIRDHGELFISTVVQFLRRKVPQLSGTSINKDDQMRPIVQMPLLPETVQTILKCISASTNNIATELSQEIFQMNLQAKLLLDKPNLTIQQQQQLKSGTLMGGNQGTFDMLQSMMNNINMNAQTTNLGINNYSNSPNKMILSGISSLQSSTLQPGLSRLNSPQINLNPSNQFDNKDTIQYSKEIEEDVEKCIQGLFKLNSLSPEDFINILSKLKDSQDKKDKDFYTSALKYIIDVNNCLSDLDEMQFHTMSTVWGLMIDRDVLSNQTLSYCLKLLVQMLSKPITSRYYRFGIDVIDRCKNRLKDYVTFCQWILQLQNFQQFPRVLKDYIDFGARGIHPPNNPFQSQIASLTQNMNLSALNNIQHGGNPTQISSINNFLANKFTNGSNTNQANLVSNQLNQISSNLPNSSNHARSMGAKPSIANTTNIETLLVANEDGSTKPIAPSEAIQDKIGFIFNNLSLSNMQLKSDELKEVLKEDFWDWIAHYLVVKRVSIEPNFHTLYSQFIDTLKKSSMSENILTETYRNIKVLLRSDKNDQKFCDRALLKNLGSWLGLITLAKNRPILHKDIDLKSLIIEAFQKGQAELLFVVPFVAKVLEPAGKSKIFQPPNPWLYSMLSVLVELHNEPDLKLNHKFEIEVLCKNLNLNINDISVKGCLRNYEIIEEQLTKLKDTTSTAQTTKSETTQNIPAMPLNQQQGQQVAETTTNTSEINTTSHTMHSQSNGTFISQVSTPKYKISDIKLQSLQNNSNLIYISTEIPLLNVQPALKNFIIPTLDKAVNEMMHLLLEKAVKISVSTAEPLIKKDFSLDPEENHMRIAARNMVANMSSGMMLITGKEPLTQHLFNALKTQFTQSLDQTLANTYKEIIHQACSVIVQDNIELCMCFLQKIAIQRSIMELERKLLPDFETRQRARVDGRVHYESSVFNYHAEKMPDMIKLRVGSVSPQQFSVYEEFGKNLPGFKINMEESRTSQSNFNQVVDEMNIHYENAIVLLKNEVNMMQNGHFLTNNLQALAHVIHDFKVSQQPQSAYNLIKKLVFNLLEGSYLMQSEIHGSNLPDHVFLKYRENNLAVLKVILSDQRFCTGNWIVKEVQKIWLECNQDFKYSVEGIAILIKYKLLNAQAVDLYLAQFIESGNAKALGFALQFLKYFYIENASAFVEIQFANLLDALNKALSFQRNSPQYSDLRDVIEVIRINYEIDEPLNPGNRIAATALSMMYTGVKQAKEFDDPAGLKEKSDQLLHDWIQHHSMVPQKENTKAFQQFVLQMNTQGMFKTDEMITRFFRICTEICVESCYFYLSNGRRAECYQRLDAFVKLIILLVKHSGDQTNHVNKINLFNKVLGLIAGCLLHDQENKGTNFEPMPFHRLFYMLLFEAALPDNNLEPILNDILHAFINVYNIIRPAKAPGFAYSWLELIAHRIFISKMLQVNQPAPDQTFKKWNMYATILTQLLRFLAPFLRNIELTQSIMLLYKGTLRLFLVLLHDFPEFLCNCHYQFCDVIPSNCIQLRNLVLSAFPRCMKLPDPLTPNLKVDMIADIDSSPPKIAYPYVYNIPHKLKNDLDSYIKTRAPVTFLSDLRSYLQSSPDAGSHYNIQLMNALVIYVGTYGITALRSKGLTPTHNNLTHAAHSAHSDIFQSLVVDLDSEGRYLFINAVANQLRYPNSHTHYFGCALLNLFSEANTEAIQEQITRVLLERLIVNRPHPWGLLVTFIELIKNPQFKFWNHQFVHCAPEIEKMFQSLGRNCMMKTQ